MREVQALRNDAESKAKDATGTSRILVVDDSALIRDQLRLCLTRAGYQVIEADDGLKGLETARDNQVDVFIIDVNMPTMDGLELLEQLRNIEAYVKTPVFMLTTESSPSLVAQGRELRVMTWIVKPFRETILLKAIEYTLGLASKA